MICYFDSCSLVKRYIRETDSDRIARLLAESTPATARLSVVDIISALSRRCREGDLDLADRDAAIEALNQDMDRIFLIELTRVVGDIAGRLLTQHVLRAGDAVQLASCLHLQNRTSGRIRFVTHDSKLLEAAKAEGLQT